LRPSIVQRYGELSLVTDAAGVVGASLVLRVPDVE